MHRDRAAFVTHDNGRSWQRIPAPCPSARGGMLASGGPESLWVQCQGQLGVTLRISTDGGRRWQTVPTSLGPVFALEPASARVAWALTVHGDVARTTDSGDTWRTVWTVGGSQPATLAGHTPRLVAEGSLRADILVSLTRGHVQDHAAATNLVLYRTTDGGVTWTPSVVRLPAGAR